MALFQSFQPVKPLTGLADSSGAAAGPWEAGGSDAPHTFMSLLGRKSSEQGREESNFYLSELILKGWKTERIVWEVGKKWYS